MKELDMRRYCLSLCLVFWFASSAAIAADVQVTETLVFSVDLKTGWSLHLDDPPAPLVKEIASHIAHEPAAANATEEQIERVARKRLLANEAILYHAESGAHLDIDFSPLSEGEKEPTSRTLKNSAKYAAESLSSEEDIEDVDWEVSSVTINGARETYLLSANYLQHDHPMTFLGYIGFVADSWFFLYFTAPGKDPVTLTEVKEMLAKASVRQVEQ
jgi:hypothetical protein